MSPKVGSVSRLVLCPVLPTVQCQNITALGLSGFVSIFYIRESLLLTHLSFHWELTPTQDANRQHLKTRNKEVSMRVYS